MIMKPMRIFPMMPPGIPWGMKVLQYPIKPCLAIPAPWVQMKTTAAKEAVTLILEVAVNILGTSPRRLQKRMKKKRVAIKGNQLIPSSPRISWIRLCFTKLTSDSIKFCSPLGMSLPIRPARVRVRKTRTHATHIEMTALVMEMSIPPIFNGMTTWGWRCSIKFINVPSHLGSLFYKGLFFPVSPGGLPYCAKGEKDNKGDQGCLKMNRFNCCQTIENDTDHRQTGNKSNEGEGNRSHFVGM